MPALSMFDLSGHRACVTGASSGIGQALATAFARAGATVVGVARRPDALAAWRDDCLAEGLTVDCVPGDVSALDNIETIANQVAEPFGAPDIVLNAAGLNPRRPADDVSMEEWRSTLDINLSAPFFLARALIPAMRDTGWGRIINIASLQSERAFANGIAYGASKGGVTQLTRAMAEAWSADGINCNALAPGFFPTELTAPVFGDEDTAQRLAGQTCIGRNGMLDDLVGPAVFLASRASDYVTGQVLYVDGGFTAK